MNKVIIVTGASSGIGKETAFALAGMGHKVYDFSRRDFADEKIEHIKVDVPATEFPALLNSLKQAMQKDSLM